MRLVAACLNSQFITLQLKFPANGNENKNERHGKCECMSVTLPQQPTREMWKNANGGERRRVPLSDLTNSNPTRTRPNPLPFNRCGAVGLDVSDSISSKNQKRAALALPISNIRDNSNGALGLNLPKAKPLTRPCRKKQRVVSCEQDASKDPQLQDFIEKQKAYFKEIDEFKLAEEEVESIDELD